LKNNSQLTINDQTVFATYFADAGYNYIKINASLTKDAIPTLRVGGLNNILQVNLDSSLATQPDYVCQYDGSAGIYNSCKKLINSSNENYKLSVRFIVEQFYIFNILNHYVNEGVYNFSASVGDHMATRQINVTSSINSADSKQF
jgi:hypothetical protein